MLDDATAKKILRLTKAMWAEKARTESFLNMTKGKEVGHRIADFVDDHTTSLLKAHFETRFEASTSGKRRSRSMGDLWLQSGGIFNPINVKTGEADKKGQPNLVSLKKLLRALLRDQIDSYYLLIVKFRLGTTPSADVYLVDLLDCLSHVAYDAGPGQMMLKEKSFYQAAQSGALVPKTMPLSGKISGLFDLLEDGDRRLTLNRAEDLALLRGEFADYKSRKAHPIDQSELHLIHE